MFETLQEVEKQLNDHISIAEATKSITGDIAKVVDLLVETFNAGNKVLLAGNGGSAADAQHWAAEWTIRLSHHLERPSMPAIALTTDTSALTAGGNDIGFDNIFARQMEGLGAQGDVFIAISTSGNSENVIRAMKVASDKGIKNVGIMGNTGGKMKELCDLSVIVPSDSTQRIQEMHCFVGHMMCELSERKIYED